MTNIIKQDFNGHSISFSTDGWVNATAVAASEGRRLDVWLKTVETKDYIAALARHLNTTKRWDLIRTFRGRDGGTWLHPKLAVAFARWISPDFAVWCDLQIDALIRNGIVAQGNDRILSLVLRSAPAKWQLRFHPSYYKALARVTGTTYTGHVGGTPPLYGHITDKWVYGAILPCDVHAELKARKHQSEKMHQWLTDGGQQRLDQHVTLITLLAQSSVDLKDFEARCMQSFGMPGQLRIVFPVAA